MTLTLARYWAHTTELGNILKIERYNVTLRKICENTDFLLPAFSGIRTESTILLSYGKMLVRENSFSRIFYAVSSKLQISFEN